MFQTVDCDLFLYIDDSSLVGQHKDPRKIEQTLNKIFKMSVTGLWITNSAFKASKSILLTKKETK